MSSAGHDSSLKHRHDVGEPDHGPTSTELTTRGIQLALGVGIFGTLALLIYFFVQRGA